VSRPKPETRAFLDGISAFSELPSELLDAMWEHMEARSFDTGEMLMRQEDPGDCLLVLLSGSAEVSAHGHSGVVRVIAELEQGQIVGEMALITGESRGADVVAREPVNALALAAEEFHGLARKHPELGIVLTNLIADRLGCADWDILGGKIFEGYEILQCVGRGGMAIVYEARETAHDRRVALKMMSHRLVYDVASLSRFRQEADIVQKLEHDNIARLFGRFSAYGTHLLVMEFIDGPGLDRLVKKRQPVSETYVRPIVGQLASALRYVHARNLLHRDIKPSNVMLTSKGVVKLMDFGLAKPLVNLDDRTITHERALIGTPSYMAPEQLSGEEADSRADVYGLACLAHTLLTGQRPFAGCSNLLDLVRSKLACSIPPADQIGFGVSAEMHQFLVRGLAPAREDRLPDLDAQVGWAREIDIAALDVD
jgi:tRNA A-37 threonylcarbamoyl transferase component Bud32